ncbi:hypothetical protein D3C76_1385080 [compost metagenome]
MKAWQHFQLGAGQQQLSRCLAIEVRLRPHFGINGLPESAVTLLDFNAGRVTFGSGVCPALVIGDIGQGLPG